MNWSNLYMQYGGFQNPREGALLMSAAWAELARWPDLTVVQTAMMNIYDPLGILNLLQARGVPVPSTLIEQLRQTA